MANIPVVRYSHYGGEWWSRDRAPDFQSRGRWFYATYRRFEVRQFRSPHICLCLSEETLKADALFYLVSMPQEIKDSSHVVNVYHVVVSLILDKRITPALAKVWAVGGKPPKIRAV